MNKGFENFILSGPRPRGSTLFASLSEIPIGSLARLTFEGAADRRSP
jgi:hypothetical protein